MINNVVLVGRLTKPVNMKVAQTGNQVGTFTLAVNRTFGKKEQEADFIDCVAFGKSAEILEQYTDKGSQVGITGRIQTRNYENKEGRRVYVTEVVANSVQLLDSKPAQDGQRGGATRSNGGSYTNAYGGASRGSQAPSRASREVEENPFMNMDGPVDISSDDLPF